MKINSNNRSIRDFMKRVASLLAFVFLNSQPSFLAARTPSAPSFESVEYIYRLDRERSIPPLLFKEKSVQPYPWERRDLYEIPRITKEYFRCRGIILNPPRKQPSLGDGSQTLYDCGGSSSHGLPIRGEKEYVYPVLIDLLNHLQQTLKKRVVIQSGHRCPLHNSYVDPSIKNAFSKHLIGAEVDFYVSGYENRPEEVVAVLMDYYKRHPLYQNQKDYCEFERFTKQTDVSTLPWYNKEIFIKIFKEQEGRNFDNCHLYPYITLQARFDREKNVRVQYNFDQAQRYHRY